MCSYETEEGDNNLLLSMLCFAFFIITLILFAGLVSGATKTPKLISTEEAERRFIHNTIVNPHNYNYTLNPSEYVCTQNRGEHIYLLVIVHTAPENFRKRLAIRDTWGERRVYKNKMRIVFMMGDTNSTEVKTRLNYEFDAYGDIVQENFLDTYKNLTYKAIMALKWMSEYCNRAKYVLKVDDDMFVNTLLVWRRLKSFDRHNISMDNTFMCYMWKNAVVFRKNDQKWFVSYEEYGAKLFGDYCAGASYIIQTEPLVHKLLNASNYVKFFWIDDYYVTGLLARALNSTFYNLNSLFVLYDAESKHFKNYKNDFRVFGHFKKSDDMYRAWYHTTHNDYQFYFSNTEFKYDIEYKWTLPLKIA